MANARVKHPLNTTNFTIVYLGEFQIGFSYETPIAFYDYDESEWVLRENDWGPTTGKHLNYFFHKEDRKRLNSDEFEARLSKYLKGAYV